MTWTRKVLDVVFFVLGPVLLVTGILSFSSNEAAGDNSIAVSYSYGTDALSRIGTGIALIAFGLVHRSWTNESK